MLKRAALLTLFACCIFTGCSTDFEISADWKEIAVVYGLLDHTQEDQYIRIHKAFLDEETSALELAQIPDSLYFKDETTAVLKGYTYSVNNRGEVVLNSLINERSLQKVLASDEGIFQDEQDAVFATQPYFLYKTSNQLNNDLAYKLEIETERGNTVSAVTPLMGDFSFSRPREDDELNLTGLNADIRLWFIPPANSEIYDMMLTIVYSETINNDPTQIEVKSLDMSIFSGETRNTLIQRNSGVLIFEGFTPNKIVDYMSENIQENPDVFRKLEFFEFTLFGGTQILADFIDVSVTAQNSLSVGQVKPEFTNVENGLGLFTSRFKGTVKVNQFTPGSRDLLACDDRMSHLGFIKSSPSAPDCN